MMSASKLVKPSIPSNTCARAIWIIDQLSKVEIPISPAWAALLEKHLQSIAEDVYEDSVPDELLALRDLTSSIESCSADQSGFHAITAAKRAVMFIAEVYSFQPSEVAMLTDCMGVERHVNWALDACRAAA